MGFFRYPFAWKDVKNSGLPESVLVELEDRDRALEDYLTNTAVPTPVSSGILAQVSYELSTLTSWSISTVAFASIDATNLAVTFTAPASGNVLVVLEGVVLYPSGMNFAETMTWGVLEGAGPTLIGAGVVWQYGGSATSQPTKVRHTLSLRATGLASGDHTFEWAAMQGGGSTAVLVSQINNGNVVGAIPGPASMTVHALP